MKNGTGLVTSQKRRLRESMWWKNWVYEEGWKKMQM
jgi:hypothetical protein